MRQRNFAKAAKPPCRVCEKSFKVFAAVQTIFGAILLFLFGLGIRNKFRVK